MEGARGTKKFTSSGKRKAHLIEQASFFQTLVVRLLDPNGGSSSAQVAIRNLLIRIGFSKHCFRSSYVFFNVRWGKSEDGT